MKEIVTKTEKETEAAGAAFAEALPDECLHVVQFRLERLPVGAYHRGRKHQKAHEEAVPLLR